MKTRTRKSLHELWFATKATLQTAWREGRKQILMLGFLAFLVAGAPYLVSGIQALVINELVALYGSGVASTTFIVLCGALILVFLFRENLYSYLSYIQKVTWFQFRHLFVIQFSQKMCDLDMATHEDPVFQNEVQLVREQGESFVVADFLETFIMNLQNIIGFFIAAGVVFLYNPLLLGVILVTGIPRFWAEFKYGEHIWSIYQTHSEERRQYSEMKRHTERTDSLRELTVFQTAHYFIGRLQEILGNFFQDQKVAEKKRLKTAVISRLFSGVGLGVAVVVIGSQVVTGNIQVGTFTFLLSSVLGLQTATAGFFLSLTRQHRIARAVTTFFTILDKEPQVKQPKDGYRLDPDEPVEIVFDNVSFAYPGSTDELVLRNIDLTIQAGEKIALVGINGAGKSTFIKLLCRFRDPTAGAIYINGIDLREIDLPSWYAKLAPLTQEFQTYKLQVKDLIQLGRLNGALDHTQEVYEAARQANAHTFINKWKWQYEQQIGPEFASGVDPSQGQKQSLALARVLYRKAQVVILDEPTAHIDALSEKEIFDQIMTMYDTSQTFVLVSHRFSTVRSADRICVLDNGGITEVGSHTHLLAEDGVYASMFRAQAKGYV